MKKKIVALILLVLCTSKGEANQWRQHNRQSKVNAGMLLYSYDKQGRAYFLIAKEGSSGTWADFGGKAEKEDSNTLATALRECAEETRLIFGKYASLVLNKRLKKWSSSLRIWRDLERPVRNIKYYQDASNRYLAARVVKSVDHPRKYYRMYLAKVDFIPARVFNNAARIKGFDKIEYAWVPAKLFMESIRKASDRNNAYYGNKKIRRQFYDTLKANYWTIIRLIYGVR